MRDTVKTEEYFRERYVITNRNLKTGWYRGYWCIAAAALVKALKLDDTELKDCKYYSYDMAHFCQKIKRAGDTTYFDMGEDWEIQTKEYWLDKRGKQMFKLYNRPAIDDAINRFSHDPRNYHDCALEWEYIKNKMNIDEFDVDDVLIYREDGFWYVEK